MKDCSRFRNYSSESEYSRQISSISASDSETLEYQMRLQLLEKNTLSTTLYDNEMSQTEISYSTQVDIFFLLVEESFVLLDIVNPALLALLQLFTYYY